MAVYVGEARRPWILTRRSSRTADDDRLLLEVKARLRADGSW